MAQIILTKSGKIQGEDLPTKHTSAAALRIRRESAIRRRKPAIPLASRRHFLGLPPDSKFRSDLLDNLLRRQMRFDAADIPADVKQPKRERGYVKPDNGSGYYSQVVEGRPLERMFHCTDSFTYPPKYDEPRPLLSEDDASGQVSFMSAEEWEDYLSMCDVDESANNDGAILMVAHYDVPEVGKQRKADSHHAVYDGEAFEDITDFARGLKPRTLWQGLSHVSYEAPPKPSTLSQVRQAAAESDNYFHTADADVMRN